MGVIVGCYKMWPASYGTSGYPRGVLVDRDFDGRYLNSFVTGRTNPFACVVDPVTSDVWITNQASSTVARLKNDGTFAWYCDCWRFSKWNWAKSGS